MRPAFYPRAGRPQGQALRARSRGLDSRPFSPRVLAGRHERTQPRKELSHGEEELQIVTLYGNLGGDPKVHQVPRAEGTRNVYDPPMMRGREALHPAGPRIPHRSPSPSRRRRWMSPAGSCVDWTTTPGSSEKATASGSATSSSAPTRRMARPGASAVRRQDCHPRTGEDSDRGGVRPCRAPGHSREPLDRGASSSRGSSLAAFRANCRRPPPAVKATPFGGGRPARP